MHSAQTFFIYKFLYKAIGPYSLQVGSWTPGTLLKDIKKFNHIMQVVAKI